MLLISHYVTHFFFTIWNDNSHLHVLSFLPCRYIVYGGWNSGLLGGTGQNIPGIAVGNEITNHLYYFSWFMNGFNAIEMLSLSLNEKNLPPSIYQIIAPYTTKKSEMHNSIENAHIEQKNIEQNITRQNKIRQNNNNLHINNVTLDKII